MADVHSPEIRSYNMSRIKGKNTKPEEIVRKYLFAQGFRYRKNDKRLLGKPDIVLPKYHTCIFVNGCFWHRHPGCKYATTPQTRKDFWEKKFEENVSRDQRVYEELKKQGWNIVCVWGCELNKDRINQTLEEIYKCIINKSERF